jgi:hypothetical protein
LLHGEDGDFITIEYFNTFDSDVVHSPRVILGGDTGAPWFSYQDYFPSYMVHRVTPITSGTRKAIVAWVTGPGFK